MKPIWKLAAATAGGAAAAALSALPASAATVHSTPAPAHPVFVQTDNTAGNTIVAYERTATGGLQQVGSYPTGGNGGILTGSVIDHLASKGALAYDGQAGLLYAVNAGSDTITVFSVRGDQLVRSQVISSDGQFPVSITAHGNQLYVLNALGGASVSGFVQVGGRLIPRPSWHRDLAWARTPPRRSLPHRARSDSPPTGRTWWSRPRAPPTALTSSRPVRSVRPPSRPSPRCPALCPSPSPSTGTGISRSPRPARIPSPPSASPPTASSPSWAVPPPGRPRPAGSRRRRAARCTPPTPAVAPSRRWAPSQMVL